MIELGEQKNGKNNSSSSWPVKSKHAFNVRTIGVSKLGSRRYSLLRNAWLIRSAIDELASIILTNFESEIFVDKFHEKDISVVMSLLKKSRYSSEGHLSHVEEVYAMLSGKRRREISGQRQLPLETLLVSPKGNWRGSQMRSIEYCFRLLQPGEGIRINWFVPTLESLQMEKIVSQHLNQSNCTEATGFSRTGY